MKYQVQLDFFGAVYKEKGCTNSFLEKENVLRYAFARIGVTQTRNAWQSLRKAQRDTETG